MGKQRPGHFIVHDTNLQKSKIGRSIKPTIKGNQSIQIRCLGGLDKMVNSGRRVQIPCALQGYRTTFQSSKSIFISIDQKAYRTCIIYSKSEPLIVINPALQG